MELEKKIKDHARIVAMELGDDIKAIGDKDPHYLPIQQVRLSFYKFANAQYYDKNDLAKAAAKIDEYLSSQKGEAHEEVVNFKAEHSDFLNSLHQNAQPVKGRK